TSYRFEGIVELAERSGGSFATVERAVKEPPISPGRIETTGSLPTLVRSMSTLSSVAIWPGGTKTREPSVKKALKLAPSSWLTVRSRFRMYAPLLLRRSWKTPGEVSIEATAFEPFVNWCAGDHERVLRE